MMPLAQLLAGLLACSRPHEQADTGVNPAAVSAALAIGPRFQWEENFGYCGETSFISAGLYYGQYLSQYDARALASPGVPQQRASSQLLLGVNDTAAAAAMHLDVSEWQGSSADDFLVWVRANVAAGNPVIIGVYNNEYLLYGETSANAGDAEYDHIVPVTAVQSAAPLDDQTFHSDDTLTFSDNGLVGDNTPQGSDYFYTSGFTDFEMSRAEANKPDAPYYGLSNTGANYGVAITGVTDPNHETSPVSLSTSANFESPEIIDGSDTRPAASPVDITVTVSGLTAGADYTLFRYNAASSVPNASFGVHAGDAAASWPIHATAATWTMTETTQSSDEAFYRAVAGAF